MTHFVLFKSRRPNLYFDSEKVTQFVPSLEQATQFVPLSIEDDPVWREEVCEVDLAGVGAAWPGYTRPVLDVPPLSQAAHQPYVPTDMMT